MPGRGGPLTYSYFRGFVAPGSDAQNAEKYVVAIDDKAHKFFMADKSTVMPTRMTRTIFARSPTWALDLCHEYAICAKGKSCHKLHVSAPPTQLEVHGNGAMLVCLKNGTNTLVAPSDMEPTAGLMFVSKLKAEGLVREVYPWVCQRFLEGACHRGAKCLALHVNPDLVKNIKPAPVEASTTIIAALQQSLPTTPGLQPFIETTLNRMGLRTVADIAVLSNLVFEALMQRDIHAHPHNRTFWLLIIQQRTIGRSTPLKDALKLFPGIDMKSLDAVGDLPNLLTVSDLLTIRQRTLYHLPLRAQLLDACERLRARFEDEREVYSQINLVDLPPTAFFRRMATLVCEFRKTHAHKSWRKQDATRPIVTSAITYVDPDECTCSLDQSSQNNSQSFADSPHVGPRDPHTGVPSMQKAPSDIPSLDHWCQCPRKHEIAVNYELSTPSGSRCSEQNALGYIASMGLPTSCIREVFVHGGVHNSDDPNPLFPCGVCENMFRRVSKDVQKKHGGDVLLYMFDQEASPRKLVCIPVSEISHREGSHFRRFVTEDLRVEGYVTTTPTGSMHLDDPTSAVIPAVPPESPRAP